MGPSTAKALILPINASGIQGRIVFLDTGSPDNLLVISGTATGLDAAQQGDVYFSLLYNVGSVATGPTACIPAPPPAPQITKAQMFTAFWRVNPDGMGTLLATKSGDFYVPLSQVGTMSIREATPGSNAPFFNVLRACGQIRRNP
jgi:hypothetical protein